MADNSSTLLINELYASIQGESSHAGRPCVFIRLTGCPLRCNWCDSEFSFSGGERMSIESLLENVAEHGIKLVEVTGGEPLAQLNCLPLLSALCDAGYEVLLETSGAFDVAEVDPRVGKIIDIKCPGSGESAANRWENLQHLGPHDEIKFVLADRTDYEWAREVLYKNKSMLTGHFVHFSPVLNAAKDLPSAELAQWIIDDRLPVRLQLQLHKIVWPGQTQKI